MTRLKEYHGGEIRTWAEFEARAKPRSTAGLTDKDLLRELVIHDFLGNRWKDLISRAVADHRRDTGSTWMAPLELWLCVDDERLQYFGPLGAGTLPMQTMLLVRVDRPPQALWYCDGKLYTTSDVELDERDVSALVHEAANKRRLQLQKAHALQDMTKAIDDSKLRKPIPREVKLEVWQRDGGRCVECGSQKDLEYDHVIPLALGGSNTARNLQLLCAVCNNRKGASLG